MMTRRDLVRSALGAGVLAVALAPSGQLSVMAQAPRAPRTPPLSCVVAKLADGDSLTCTDGRKVRLLLIDTPELQQKPWGLMAKRQLEVLARPGTVLRLELDRTPRDRYGRTLAYAWVGDVMLNERMVANGWAVVLAYQDVRYLERMKRAERAAQSARRGLWQAWAFRCRPVDFRAHRCIDSPAPEQARKPPQRPAS
jgi:micrococcal nuclease